MGGHTDGIAVGWKPAGTLWGVTMPGERDRPAPERVAAPPASQYDAETLAQADDATLVTAFLSGCREAFDVIVERHRRNVYQLCYRFVGNHEDASDLAQDVFVRAFKGLRNFKGDASLGTWLYRVGVNACLNRVAVKRPQTEPIEAVQRIDDRLEDPLETLMRDERAAVVRVAIQRLPPKQRATLMLRVYQELPHEEIAKILGSSVGAVKANFFHALGNLRRFMGEKT
jgi:RNA polymerase sigma-70 factor (ECF subfamily)